MRYEAKYIPTVEDWLTAIHMHNKKRDDDNRKLCVFIGVGLAIIFNIAAYCLHFLALSIFGILFGILMPLMPWLIRQVSDLGIRMEDRIRRRSKEAKEEALQYYFTEDGVEFSKDVAQSNYSWNVFTKSLLDERGILLCLGLKDLHFIPSRAFVDGYFPLQELKSLVSRKIKNV
jgi:hypothetical protein